MKKIELEKLVEDQEEKINEITNNLEYWMDEHSKLEHEVADLEYKLTHKWDDFIFKLKSDGLYSEAIEKFINYYERFYGDQ